MKNSTVLIVLVGFFLVAGFASPVHGSPTGFTLSDELMMTFDDTYVKPFEGWADLTGKTDLPGVGVQFDVAIYGAWTVEMGIGTPYDADLSAYDTYALTVTNMTDDDTFNVNLYLKTGPSETYYGSPWWTLLPGTTAPITLDVTSVPNMDDVRGLGLGVEAWAGNEFGMADAIRVVKVAGDEPYDPLRPIPEASTLMLFGSGLAGIMAIARRKFRSLSKQG